MAGPVRGRADYLDLGNYNAVCSMCGHKFKASELIKHWQGMYRCSACWEPRHPQEYVRAVPDIQTPPWTQPEPADVFVTFCTPNGMTSIVDFATVDCVVIEYASPFFDPAVTT